MNRCVPADDHLYAPDLGLPLPGLAGARLYGPAARDLLVSTAHTESCVSLGNFDGVHLGHQALLRAGRDLADQRKLPLVVVTFEPHPLAVLSPAPPPRLLEAADRLALIRQAGADAVLMLPFTRELAAQPTETFVRNILCARLGMKELLLGHDFSMGKGRAGTPEVLATLGREIGFGVDQVPPFRLGEVVVSSTLIREELARGHVAEAAALLGRPHSLRGTVAHGLARGRTLGFPTANLTDGAVMRPAVGVYASQIRLKDGSLHPAVTNIGHNPTFGPAHLTVESHLLNFSGDLYGQNLCLSFIQRLRGEQRFAGPEALIAQIRADIAAARKWV